MTKEEKAILDTIAYAEGTLGVSNNGYDVVVTFKVINGWTDDTKIVHGDGDWLQNVNSTLKSSAAGRYQFLGSTWKSLHGGNNPPMSKANQDAAGIKLVNKRLKQNFTSNESVTISELANRSKFDIFLQKCAPEWASLPLTKDIPSKGKKAGNGYYSGQGGKKSAQELYDIFILALSKY